MERYGKCAFEACETSTSDPRVPARFFDSDKVAHDLTMGF